MTAEERFQWAFDHGYWSANAALPNALTPADLGRNRLVMEQLGYLQLT
jgi:hypothetical protein